jgi:hypothetical protein
VVVEEMMFTFVIWAIGLAILIGMVICNIGIIAVAFRKHWTLGVLCMAVSLLVWPILLAQIV